jgi:hypothetical protein
MSTERYPKKLAAELHQFRINKDEEGPANVLSFIVMPCFHGADGWFGLFKHPATQSWVEMPYQEEESKALLAARIRERLSAEAASVPTR